MEDQELLEKAAKAAGIDLEWDGPPEMWTPIYYKGKTYHAWNPLTDDGDAFRLAVALRIDLHFEDNGAIGNIVEAMSPEFADGSGTRWCMSESTDEADPYAATRRAIVRAAAAMA